MHRFPHEFDPEAQVHAELNVHSSTSAGHIKQVLRSHYSLNEYIRYEKYIVTFLD